MDIAQGQTLKGARVLILEDEYLIADDIARALRDAGAKPVGPVASISQAEDLLKRERIDAAILDLNLRGNMAFELAERLAAEKLPCLILSGYGRDTIPPSLAGMPRLEKPANPALVIQSLAAELER